MAMSRPTATAGKGEHGAAGKHQGKPGAADNQHEGAGCGRRVARSITRLVFPPPLGALLAPRQPLHDRVELIEVADLQGEQALLAQAA